MKVAELACGHVKEVVDAEVLGNPVRCPDTLSWTAIVDFLASDESDASQREGE